MIDGTWKERARAETETKAKVEVKSRCFREAASVSLINFGGSRVGVTDARLQNRPFQGK